MSTQSSAPWDDTDRLVTLQREGVSIREAAKRLGVPVPTASSHWYKIKFAGIDGDVRREAAIYCGIRGRDWFRTEEIAQNLDMDPQTVREALDRLTDSWDALEQDEVRSSNRTRWVLGTRTNTSE